MIVFIVNKDLINFFPFIIELFPILLNLPHEYQILKLTKLIILPHHWEVRSGNDFKVRMPKGFLFKLYLMHDIDYHRVIFSISMCFEDLRMFIED